ncbi:hypothetical protein JTB14_019456 [Gonioctena quinquepunctata]|nr:hypothetical protein JTB14_019456 [Gonioctena quinquepunctata]
MRMVDIHSAENQGTSKSREIAKFRQSENTFINNRELYQQYSQFMDEYLHLGHMKKVPFSKINQEKYYIPHQAEMREESTTTKLRVVFDESYKTTTDLNLNGMMYTGPRLQNDLTDTLLRWKNMALHLLPISKKISASSGCIQKISPINKYCGDASQRKPYKNTS